jgi:hypothetical protein
MDETKNVVESHGDRMADIIENTSLSASLIHVMVYVENIVQNAPEDNDAKACLKVLESMSANVTDAIGVAIE